MDDLIEVMRRDKKVVSGNMVFVLVNRVGEAFLSADVPEDLVRAVLKDSLGDEEKGTKGKWKSKFSSHS